MSIRHLHAHTRFHAHTNMHTHTCPPFTCKHAYIHNNKSKINKEKLKRMSVNHGPFFHHWLYWGGPRNSRHWQMGYHTLLAGYRPTVHTPTCLPIPLLRNLPNCGYSSYQQKLQRNTEECMVAGVPGREHQQKVGTGDLCLSFR